MRVVDALYVRSGDGWQNSHHQDHNEITKYLSNKI